MMGAIRRSRVRKRMDRYAIFLDSFFGWASDHDVRDWLVDVRMGRQAGRLPHLDASFLFFGAVDSAGYVHYPTFRTSARPYVRTYVGRIPY
jgi:hypothetical protein